jgi:2-methylcitrate dehydratase PrpD
MPYSEPHNSKPKTQNHVLSEAEGSKLAPTERLAAFVAAGSYDTLPTEAIERSRVHVLDALAVMLAGATSEGTRIVHGWLREMTGRGQAEVVGAGFRAPATLAAFANGCAGHALDYDDTIEFTSDASVYGTRLHPSVPTLAAALAAAEVAGASGRDLLTAFVYGFEATCRLADATNREHYRRGYHPTGVIGPLGAALAAGKLLGLDETALRCALGIAASSGGGLRENYGTMTKPFHAGRAAESGVVAAMLAARGFSASQNVLEAERGFYRAFAGDFDEGRLLDHLGDPFYLVWPGAAIKPYPSGSLTHPALDAVFELIQENNLRSEEVERVEVGSNSNLLGSLIHNDAKTGLEAKFSMPACVALAFVERRLGIAQVQDEVVARADVQAFMRRVHLYVHPQIEALGYDQPRAIVEVHLRDGRLLSRRADAAQGTSEKPMTRGQLLEKARDCAELVMTAEKADELIACVEHLEDESDASRLAGLLRPTEAALQRSQSVPPR